MLSVRWRGFGSPARRPRDLMPCSGSCPAPSSLAEGRGGHPWPSSSPGYKKPVGQVRNVYTKDRIDIRRVFGCIFHVFVVKWATNVAARAASGISHGQ